ncbi:MAG: hypothetical protein MUC49_02710 [Raineya sp.]|jgi:hypothetical protein|nr:hypothetical protein [Raineya sp.]
MKKFEIDNFIKDKLAHLQPEFDEQAWDDLERKLDNEDDDRKAILWWWHWDKIAAIFVVGFFGYLTHYLYTNHSQKNNNQAFTKIQIKKSGRIEKKIETLSSSKEQQEIVYSYQEPKTISKTLQSKKLVVAVSQQYPQEAQTLSFDRNLQDKYFHNDFSDELNPNKVFLIDSNLTFKQEITKKNKHKRQSFGVALSPVISPKGLQAGLGYTHQVALSEKVSVVSGISYTPWTSNMPMKLTGGVTSSMGSVRPDVKVKLNTIEIPLEAKVKVAKNVAVSGGISNTLLLKETIGNVVNNDPELSISSINLGVSYDIKISKNSQLNLQPYYRIPIQSVGISGTQFSGFGLRTGFSYNTR